MYDLTAKIFLFPALLFLSSRLVSGLNFGAVYQLLLTGALLAIFAAAIDHLWLNKIKNPMASLLDGVLTVLFVWGANFIWAGTSISLTGAVIFALIVVIAEFFTHNLLLHNHNW